MSIRKEWKKLALLMVVFLGAYWLPVGWARFQSAVIESLHLLHYYAREHVLLCLIPAFFIAGAISVFLSKATVMKYLGAGANKLLAYSVASVSGGVLAVCSCTVLPLFSGIYRMGAGLGPATTFLYAGPAINVLAIVLTAAVLGPTLGVARAVGAVVLGIVIGLLMHVLFLKDERNRQVSNSQAFAADEPPSRPLWQNAVLLASMVGVLVFANWTGADGAGGAWAAVASARWLLAGLSAAVLAGGIVAWLNLGELRDWLAATWDFAVQILPLLFAGVLIAGLLLVANMYILVMQRRKDMAVLKAVGMSPGQVMGLIVLETAIIALIGALLGFGAVRLCVTGVLLISDVGVGEIGLLTVRTGVQVIGVSLLLALVFGSLPAYQAVRQTTMEVLRDVGN